jgi:hypothetical protein
MEAMTTRFRKVSTKIPLTSLFYFTFFSWALWDRWHWSTVAQWREDQGTNLWPVVSWFIVQNHLTYRGPVLTEAAVPIDDKQNLIASIAQRSSWETSPVTIQYRIDGLWNWIPQFGTLLDPWYPNVYTLGRTYDFMLKHYYNMNAQSHMNVVEPNCPNFIVSYSFEPAPESTHASLEHETFGRLRLSHAVKCNSKVQ